MAANPPTNQTKCNLFIPHTYYLAELQLDDEGRVDPVSLAKVVELAADNLKEIERWANLVGPLICDCDCGHTNN